MATDTCLDGFTCLENCCCCSFMKMDTLTCTWRFYV
jgi:hypothetical protein